MDFTPIDENHPVALELEREEIVSRLARVLMDEHGLYDWKFEYSNDIQTMGWCWYKEKTIKFSRRYLHHNSDAIEDTILHEIAHALVGPKVKAHGVEWRRMARQLGARPETCAESHVTPANVPKKMFYIMCSGCGRKWYRHRLQRKMIGRRSICCKKPLEGYKIK